MERRLGGRWAGVEPRLLLPQYTALHIVTYVCAAFPFTKCFSLANPGLLPDSV